MDYKQKYLKYKTKYLDLKGGKHKFGVGNIVTVKDINISSKITEVLSDGMNYLIDYMGNGLGVPEDNLIGKCPFKVDDNVLTTEPLRVIQMRNNELAGLRASEFAGIQADRIRNPDSGELTVPSRSIVTVIEVLHKDSPTPLVQGSPQKVCYRLKVRYGSNPGINIYISSNNVRVENYLDKIPSAVNCENTWNFKTWRELVEICDENREYAEDIRSCQFDFYDQEPMTFAIFRRYFPCAIGLNLSGDRALVDANFAEFADDFTSPALADGPPAVTRARGIKRLNMSQCNQVGITDAAFVNLRGIHTLNMSRCNQVGITNAAFANLRGIYDLNMSQCNQVGITDAAFVNLIGIHTLNMSLCWQVGITDAAFVNLRGIHTLNMRDCNQVGITNAAFVNLRGIHTLNMSMCNQVGITDAAFVNLRGIHTLFVINCRPNIIAVARALGLNVIY